MSTADDQLWEQLREKEQQYRSIFEATSDGLIINDLNGVVVEANPAACRMHGYSYEEFIGLHPFQFIHPAYHSLFRDYVQMIKDGSEFRGRAIDVRKDGTMLHVEVLGTRFTFKGKPHLLGVVRDITEQVQAYQVLEQRVEERTRELATLLEVSQKVASTLELKPLLGLILEQLRIVTDYTRSSIFAHEGTEIRLVESRASGAQPIERGLGMRFSVIQGAAIWEIISRGEPVIIGDVRGDSALAHVLQAVVGEHLQTTFSDIRSWLAVPLALKDRVIGMLTLSRHEPHYYTERHAKLALAFASQAAVAIENARLYERAQAVAALEERQRLARELHDSVSQALYGIALGVRTGRVLLDKDPSRAGEPLDYALSLAEAALTEMRALIFELRPESLEQEGLVAALEKQAAALRARHGLTVETTLSVEPDRPIEIKQALYRIAQEALQNMLKHAHAKRVDLRLEDGPAGLILEVCDDGVGFDPSHSFPGHLGLRSMRERMAGLGGSLTIESAPGSGTCVRALMPRSGTTT